MSEKLAKGRKGVLITIDPNGGLSTEGIGFTKMDGTKCKSQSDEIISAMGGTLVTEDKKPEYAMDQVRLRE